MEEHKLPFRVEYARSARSGCKGCRRKIAKNAIRFGRVFKVYSLLNSIHIVLSFNYI